MPPPSLLPSLFSLLPLCALACGPKPAPETAPQPAPLSATDAGAADVAPPTGGATSAPSAAPREVAPPPPAASKKITLKHDPAWAACHAAYKGRGSKDLVAEANRSGKLCESVTKMKPILTPQKGSQTDENPPQEVKFEGKVGKCYRVYAMADAGIKDLDLLLKDSTGAIAAEDSTDDSSPVLLEDGAFCFNEIDDVVLVVSVGQGKGNWALQIWSD